MQPALASALHMLGLLLTTVAIVLRDRGLEDPANEKNHKVLDVGDVLMIGTSMMLIGAGLWRLLAGLEKPTAWYLGNPVFLGKLGLVACLSGIESYLMVMFFKWRFEKRRGAPLDLRRLPLVRALNRAEFGISLFVIVLASAVAHGYGGPSPEKPATPGGDFCAVQQVFATKCLTCHGPLTRQGDLDLSTDPRTALIGVPSAQWRPELRVVVGDPARSLLWKKVEGTQGTAGLRMPMALPPLNDDEQQVVKQWIASGAPPCRK